MQYPKVSIVTPTLNSAKYLEECMLSVIQQNYPNLEYILVGRGSTDDTLSIIENYKTSLFEVLMAPGSGAAEAINKGFEISSGEIMYWLNSDDKLHKGALFAVAEVFQRFGDIEWIMGMPTWVAQTGTTYSEMSYGYSRFYQGPK
ncbi:MAG: glycosyltransferase [Bacteroidetes bacterium]|nr:glycosyltransferase [Bacteroidota bacterium]